MKIVIRKIDSNDNYTWMADRPEFPGSPLVGYGTTWQNALADLICLDQKKFGYKIEIENDDNAAII